MARFDHTDYAIENEAPLWYNGASGGDRNRIVGTAGDDRLHGTDRGDNFHVEQGGDDRLLGGAGDDHFFFGDAYTSQDVVFGGEGFDRITLYAFSASQLTLGPDNLRDVETIKTIFGSYDITLLDGIGNLRIRSYGETSDINVNASDLKSGSLFVLAGGGHDTLVGGSENDTFIGGSGADTITGGGGSDRFKYITSVDSTESTGNKTVDTLTDFDSDDRILLPTKYKVSYHIGQTDAHAGDIVVTYDQAANTSRLSIFIDSDNREDMAIYLTGRIDGLHVVHDSTLVL